MKILADQYLYKLSEMLPESADLQFYNPSTGLPENTLSFDALLIRTVTPINSETIPKAGNIKFIGTASAGFDHMDLPYLKQLGIPYGNSKGCNAHSVAEYVITCMFRWADLRGVQLWEKTTGIVGCGATGSAVQSVLERLDLPFLLFDPPKSERDPDFQTASLEKLLDCDILTFHTPLTRKSDHPTHHLCNESWLKSGFDLLIHTARGGVVDETALLKFYQSGNIKDMIIDVWEEEPVFSDELARQAIIVTPHIAGYSREAKWTATEMIVKQLCNILEVPFTSAANQTMDEIPPVPEGSLTFSELLWKYQKIKEYDRKMRSFIGMNEREKAQSFAKLRSETKLRTELRTLAEHWGEKSVPELFRVFGR